jgi:hypothetical protein
MEDRMEYQFDNERVRLVPAALQVSWCKLEVRLDSPKAITAGCPGRSDPPKLVVAALNLKTTLHPQAPFPLPI